ncbi:efflux RND transporter periplasmic adaptor subunit [Sinorhizobium alkalisoli]|uniref:Efflux transporter periplasmic adaptor subunit n=1 Tax=Sinorhizobium alkalisoli TaxID=1752398 RepID=A0A1E3VFM5_9HYPH|nr:efflux RND transporter periplasmic adaptor subunit [Sinorhizobium alkalisoli]MCG5479236.1 efflux RND transporter periplasmic adaptor subunit [Sinorhizobium alkalisoli]ODR92392.1 efflux transporter periplasmic adaptor subunit [Sinorhizobium alkalisoli]
MSKMAKPAQQDAAASSPTAKVTVIPKTPSRLRRKRRSRLWIALPILLALLGAGYYAWSQYGAQPATAILTQAVTRGDIENSVTAVGTLDAVKSVDAGAQVSGQLKSLHVAIGDRVTENQLVAEIDPASIENRIEIDQAELAYLEAQLVSKKAQLVLKDANVERQRSLVSARSASQSTLDQAIADHAAAEADVQAVEAQIRKQKATLAGDQVDLGYTKIYAPMAGTIVDNPAKEGQTLNANQTTPTIVTIADLSTMTVKAQVSEADVGKLKIGMDAYFTLLGQPGKRFAGKLRQVEPKPDTENNVVLYYALFDVPNPTGELMMSMSAQVFFVEAAASDVLLVPSAAVHMHDDAAGKPTRAQVTVVSPSGVTETRGVEIGIRNRVSAEIVSGLDEGEEVVVDTGSVGNRGDGAGTGSRRGMRMPRFF